MASTSTGQSAGSGHGAVIPLTEKADVERRDALLRRVQADLARRKARPASQR